MLEQYVYTTAPNRNAHVCAVYFVFLCYTLRAVFQMCFSKQLQGCFYYNDVSQVFTDWLIASNFRLFYKSNSFNKNNVCIYISLL